jgi:UPF0716 protein FxsA
MRTRLILFGYPLLEVATAYLVAQWIGWGWMLLLIVAGFPIGFAIMRNAGDAAMADAQRAAQTGAEIDPGRHALTFVAGLLWLVPGFWTDLAGTLLLLPPVRKLLSRRSAAWMEARVTTVRMPGVRYPTGDVIPGTVIRRDSDAPNPPGATGPTGQIES